RRWHHPLRGVRRAGVRVRAEPRPADPGSAGQLVSLPSRPEAARIPATGCPPLLLDRAWVVSDGWSQTRRLRPRLCVSGTALTGAGTRAVRCPLACATRPRCAAVRGTAPASCRPG